MTRPAVQLILDSQTAQYQPGDRLIGRYMVNDAPPVALRAAELSVLWYTAGKGDEDMAVHYFERLVDETAQPLDLRVPHRFATLLPLSPMSYDGHIVKICWCARLRLFLPHGHETMAEVGFRLGHAQGGKPREP